MRGVSSQTASTGMRQVGHREGSSVFGKLCELGVDGLAWRVMLMASSIGWGLDSRVGRAPPAQRRSFRWEQCSQGAAGTSTDYKLFCDFSPVTTATAG